MSWGRSPPRSPSAITASGSRQSGAERSSSGTTAPTPTRYQSGLGLGLYISRQIVELHGGTIAAEFPDDGGARFVIVLPSDEGASDNR